MEGEREKSRDQNEGSGQQQPLGQQDQDQTSQSGQQQQPTGQGGQQPLGQQGNFGTQEPGLGRQTDQELGGTGGQPATGEARGGDTATLNEGSQPGLGGQSDLGGASDLGGGETGLGDRQQGGFVGSQNQDSGEYLQRQGNPESGFAEQGRGASNAQDSDSGEDEVGGSTGGNA